MVTQSIPYSCKAQLCAAKKIPTKGGCIGHVQTGVSACLRTFKKNVQNEFCQMARNYGELCA